MSQAGRTRSDIELAEWPPLIGPRLAALDPNPVILGFARPTAATWSDRSAEPKSLARQLGQSDRWLTKKRTTSKKNDRCS
jgi:hypothetical protein